jgi:hypothetical protein
LSKDIATTAMTLTCTDGGAAVAVPGQASTKVKAGGSFIYAGNLAVTVSGATQGTCGSAGGPGTIIPTAIKCKSGGNFVIRKDDKATFSISGTDTGSGAACNFSVTVTVQNAGQTKAKAE